MLPSYVIVAGVVVLIVLVVIGIWYLFSLSDDEAPDDEAPAKDEQGVESTLSETNTTSATTKTDTQTAIATESTTTIVPPEDISNIEDVVPSEQIEFVNNKQSQIKTFLSTEFGFLNSLNA